METYNVYLLRHGKTLGSAALNGRTDVGVEAEYQNQIAEATVKQGFAGEVIISSPLVRCHDLALKIAQMSDNPNVAVSSKLQELSFGDYDGKTFDELGDQWENLEAFWQSPAENTLPNAEPLQDFHDRVTREWQSLVFKINSDSLIVCHAGTIRMILANVLNVDWANPSWYSALSIGYHSITHIQITKTEEIFTNVKMISKPLF